MRVICRPVQVSIAPSFITNITSRFAVSLDELYGDFWPIASSPCSHASCSAPKLAKARLRKFVTRSTMYKHETVLIESAGSRNAGHHSHVRDYRRIDRCCSTVSAMFTGEGSQQRHSCRTHKPQEAKREKSNNRRLQTTEDVPFATFHTTKTRSGTAIYRVATATPEPMRIAPMTFLRHLAALAEASR